MNTTGGNGYPLPDDAELEDVVQSEAEAIRLAEAALDYAEQYRTRVVEERSKKLGKEIRYIRQIYTLENSTEYPQGWLFTYRKSDNEGAIIHPPTNQVSVNRKTGEAKGGWFRDD